MKKNNSYILEEQLDEARNRLENAWEDGMDPEDIALYEIEVEQANDRVMADWEDGWGSRDEWDDLWDDRARDCGALRFW